MRHPFFLGPLLCSIISSLVLPLPVSAVTIAPNNTEIMVAQLTDLTLEELSQITISSVSKREENAFDAPAALYVITAEQIRQSGVTSIPDALRLAPGVHVARIDANKWAVSIRGFADRFANKLLVLQDGRSLYSPTFGGVWWNVQEIMLEDIERIEVIRGPGATLWGANAVNGVINIITRSSRQTVGGLLVAGGGSFEKGFGALRYGAALSENTTIRGYARYFSRDRQTTATGIDQEGSWENWSGGFRSDWTPTTASSLTFQGDYYTSRAGSGYYSGGNLLGRFQHEFRPATSTSLQLSYTRNEQKAVTTPDQKYREDRDTVSLDLQFNHQPHPAHQLQLGAGYRFSQVRSGNAPQIRLIPSDHTDHLPSLFLQDRITLLPGTLQLTLGLRLEHNDYTGYELQPTGRLLWTPNRTNSFWAAVSRAVRTPTQVQDSIEAIVRVLPPGSLGPGSPEARVTALGTSGLKAESLIAYEAGYRTQPLPELLLDLALFYNNYRNLIGVTAGTPYPASSHLVLPYYGANNTKGESWGAELAVTWQPMELLTLTATYAWLEMRMQSNEPQELRYQLSQIGNAPEQQFGLRSGLKLPANLRLDLWLRYVDRLRRDGINDYTELDASLAWTPLKELELSLVGQNLLQRCHNEFSGDVFGSPATRSERGLYGKVTWKF